jgi:hypothetical protein
MIQKINIFRYIGYNKPEEAYNLLRNAGYVDIQQNREYVSALLAHYVNKKGEVALKEVLQIHPDIEIISDMFKMNGKKSATGVKEPNGHFINSDDNYKQADGNDAKEVKLSEKSINLLIVGGSVVLGTTLLALIITNIVKK